MPLTLTPDQAAFLQGPLSINVGAVGRDGWPCVTRAQGIVVARDRQALGLNAPPQGLYFVRATYPDAD